MAFIKWKSIQFDGATMEHCNFQQKVAIDLKISVFVWNGAKINRHQLNSSNEVLFQADFRLK